MVIHAYSYQTRRMTALLDETEWSHLAPLLRDMSRGVVSYIRQTGCDLPTAIAKNPNAISALDTYYSLTNMRVDHSDQLWAVRAASYGRLCPECVKPFRSPKANICAECGYALPTGEVAGPLRNEVNE